jgi:predicted RecA/RadA family phage recombinase
MTWTAPADHTASVVTVSEWNAQMGVTGNMAYLKDLVDTADTDIDVLQVGNQTLIETLTSDQTGAGTKVSKTAGETFAFGEVGYLKSDGKVWKADADGSGTYPAVVIALAAINAEAAGVFLVRGIVRNDAWAWTIGGVVYLSAAVGTMTQTRPAATDNVIQVLGICHPNADTILWQPDLIYITHT